MIRKLTQVDKQDYFSLLFEVYDGLENKDWFIMPSIYERENIFKNDVTYGYFDGKQLVGASSLFRGVAEMEDVLEFSKVKSQNVAEIGPLVVKENYRGNNIAFQINQKLFELAKQKGVEYIFATVHPNNTPSNKSIQKLGLELVGTFVRMGKYLRNVYMLKIK